MSEWNSNCGRPGPIPPLVLELVLAVMTAKEMNTCARVCVSWRDQVVIEKKRRKQMSWTWFWHPIGDEGDYDNLWIDLKDFIEESWFEPTMVLVFCTDLLYSLVEFGPSDLIPFLPSKCKLHVVTADIRGGIIGTSEYMKMNIFPGYEGHCVTVLMLGHFPGVEFFTIRINAGDCTEIAEFQSQRCTKKPSCLESLQGVDVKTLNLFYTGYEEEDDEIDNKCVLSIFKMLNWPLIVGSRALEYYCRISDRLVRCQDRKDEFSFVAICGADVKVASVLIQKWRISSTEVKEKTEKAVKQLRDLNFSLNRAFGLLYGNQREEEDNMEPDIFRKHFPQTPLFGCYGPQGIFCVERQNDPSFINDEASPAKRSREDEKEEQSEEKAQQKQKEFMHSAKQTPEVSHSHATVICLISLP